MLCVLILYVKGGTDSLTSTPNDRFFENLFNGKFIYPQSFCQKYAERKSPKKYIFFHISFLDTNPGFTSNKNTLYLLDYGEFKSYNVPLLNRYYHFHHNSWFASLSHKEPTKAANGHNSVPSPGFISPQSPHQYSKEGLNMLALPCFGTKLNLKSYAKSITFSRFLNATWVKNLYYSYNSLLNNSSISPKNCTQEA